LLLNFVDENFLIKFHVIDIRHNHLAQEVVCLRDKMEEMELNEDPDNLVNGKTEYMDLGIIAHDHVARNRAVKFLPKGGDGKLKNLDWVNPNMEPFYYPLLFSRGELGFSSKLGISMCDYISSKILHGEDQFDWQSLLDPEILICTNRFYVMSQLGQVWAVDNVSRMVDDKLDYVRKNQKLLFGGLDKQNDAENENDNHANPELGDEENVYLPASVTGSPRHMRKLSCDALYAVAQEGPPTDFVTLTANVNWREILEKSLDGQTGFNRPDIVCQVSLK
jgi:hypothetical protein